MSKYFLINPRKGESDKKDIAAIRERSETLLKYGDSILEEESKNKFQQEDTLIHTEGRYVVKVDMKYKDSWRFENGQEIRYERNFNNFNRRETQPVNAIVISGEDVPKGAELLVDHNALHETNRINDYKNEFEYEGSERIRYFSIPYYECYAWRVGGSDWTPIWPFEFGLRLFKPYEGVLENIDPTVMKDYMYVVSGELAGNVVKTIKATDYQIIYQDLNGRENYLICFRPNGNTKTLLEPEAIAIMHDLTDDVNEGRILVGYSIKDAKPLNNERIY